VHDPLVKEENMSSLGRRSFWLINKLFMVPMFRLGLGPFIGNCLSGYIMVLKTIGRKTGKNRYAPVNYAIYRGNVYCMSGWGRHSDWYGNMMATREVEVILPGGTIFGVVQDVTDLEERRLVLRKILKNAGFAGFFGGFNPFTVKDDVLMEKTVDMPLVRIQPEGLGNGVSDPGGLSWVWMLLSIILIVMIIIILAG
jgi:deazaflavin-dependent oxidoreductase (nitroreductase family)